MSKGTPFFLLYQQAVDGGEALPGAKLYFYQTGTTTDQNVYQEAALSSTHAQPVVADSDGQFADIWLNPDASVDYRVRLTDSNDVQIWQVDDVPRYRENFDSGSFTALWSGFSSDPAATTANWYRMGRLIYLELPVGNGTSNSTSFQISGVPTAIRPDSQQIISLPFATDNGSVVAGGCSARISTSGTIYLAPGDATYNESGWTASGNKGLNNSAILIYRHKDS